MVVKLYTLLNLMTDFMVGKFQEAEHLPVYR
jgi:hypothetical protein